MFEVQGDSPDMGSFSAARTFMPTVDQVDNPVSNGRPRNRAITTKMPLSSALQTLFIGAQLGGNSEVARKLLSCR